EVTEGESRTCDDVEEGRVCETDPPAGESISRGDTVELIISAGPEAVEVPDVVGQSYEEAEAALEEAGLSVEREEQETTEEEPGTVLEQDPAAGEEAAPGDTVTLTVAVEPEGVQVPDVVGQQLTDAQATL